MKARHALLAALVTGAAALVSATAAVRSSDPDGDSLIRGTWSAEPGRGKTAALGPQLQLSLHRGHNSTNSHAVALADLKGLSAEQANADGGPVTFALERDAGQLAFEGTFRRGEGAGHFTFTPRAEFVAAMRELGYGTLDDEKLYSMAVLDVSRELVRELDKLGYSRLDVDQLLSMRIHGADPAFIRELKALGYDHLSVDDLVSMRIHGASPEFVRQLKDLGYDRVGNEDLVSMRIHGVSPEFIRELKALGYEHVSVEDLVSMRIHGVSPEFVRRVQATQGSVPVERLVDMRIHGRED